MSGHLLGSCLSRVISVVLLILVGMLLFATHVDVPLVQTEFIGQSEYVTYLGLTIDKRLDLTEEDIAKIARRAHHRANLI